MSRKQEIYRDILSWSLPHSRNGFSRFRRTRCLVILSPNRQRDLAHHYAVAEFVHNLYVSILDADFIDHDIHFLNGQARTFYQCNSDDNCYLYSLFAYYIQELFKEVPEARRHELLWSGPESDYSWARPNKRL